MKEINIVINKICGDLVSPDIIPVCLDLIPVVKNTSFCHRKSTSKNPKLFCLKIVFKTEVKAMLKITPQCSVCKKEIQANEQIFVKMRYPVTRGMTKIKAFLQNEGKIICEECNNK